MLLPQPPLLLFLLPLLLLLLLLLLLWSAGKVISLNRFGGESIDDEVVGE